MHNMPWAKTWKTTAVVAMSLLGLVAFGLSPVIGDSGSACDGATLSITQPATQTLKASSDATEISTPVTIAVTQSTAKSGKCYLAFSYGQHGTPATTRALTSGENRILYSLKNSESGADLSDNSTSPNASNVAIINFDGATPSQTTSAVWTVLNDREAQLGTYTDSVSITLHEGDTPAVTLPALKTETLALSAEVPSQIYATLSQDSQYGDVFKPQNATVDFGDFTQNPGVHTLDLTIFGTDGLQICMYSDNKGRLKSHDATSEVPYSLQVVPPTPLGNPVELALDTLDSNQTNPLAIQAGQYVQGVFKLNFKLGTLPEFIRAGDYQDTVTIVVQAAT